MLDLILAALVFVTAADAQASPAPRIVDLKAPDGLQLKATYFPAGKPGPGVLLLHQCNRQRKAWDALAGKLAGSGLHVLTLDLRGYGESEGARFLDLPPAEQQKARELWPGDVDQAFAYLMAQPGVSHELAGAGGASCGVNNSIQLSRRHPEVKSLVLLSGGTDRDGRRHLRSARGLRLFISAADDDGGIVDVMEWLDGLSGDPGNQFVRYETGGHGTDMFAVRKELPGRIQEWFVATLLHPRDPLPSSSARNKANPATAELFDLLDSGEPDAVGKAGKMLEDLRARAPDSHGRAEGLINQIGYERMQGGDTRGAVAVLSLNVAAFPQSPNACDSLSDAYVADGQPGPARRYAEKALTLLATDTTDPEPRRKLIRQSAEDKLKSLPPAP